MNGKRTTNEKVLKGRIIITLNKHLLEDISIEEFIEMTDLLNLDDLNQKLRNLMVEDAQEKIKDMQIEDEQDLLQLLDDGKGDEK